MNGYSVSLEYSVYLDSHSNFEFEGEIKFIAVGQHGPRIFLQHLISKGSQNGTTCFKNVNNCLNTNIHSYLDTSGGQSSNPHLNVVHFLNTRAD